MRSQWSWDLSTIYHLVKVEACAKQLWPTSHRHWKKRHETYKMHKFKQKLCKIISFLTNNSKTETKRQGQISLTRSGVAQHLCSASQRGKLRSCPISLEPTQRRRSASPCQIYWGHPGDKEKVVKIHTLQQSIYSARIKEIGLVWTHGLGNIKNIWFLHFHLVLLQISEVQIHAVQCRKVALGLCPFKI